MPLRLLKQGLTFLELIVLKAVTEFERSCLIQCNDSILMVLALAFISDVLQYRTRSLIQRHMHCNTNRLTEIRCIHTCKPIERVSTRVVVVVVVVVAQPDCLPMLVRMSQA